MLSGTPPTVTNVEVASTAWSTAFVGYLQTAGLGTNGYSIPRGSTSQSATLTWDNINQIMLTFSKDVRVDAADLSISGINTTAYGISNFRYDPQTHVATWTLNAAIDKDRLRLDLDANGSDPVRDLDQNILDGEWTNNVSTASGNGTAGGDFEFNFNVLPSDVNNTSNITAIDYTYVRQLDGKSTSSSGYVASATSTEAVSLIRPTGRKHGTAAVRSCQVAPRRERIMMPLPQAALPWWKSATMPSMLQYAFRVTLTTWRTAAADRPIQSCLTAVRHFLIRPQLIRRPKT